MAVLRSSEKLRTSNDLLLNKPSGLGREMGMLANIMLENHRKDYGIPREKRELVRQDPDSYSVLIYRGTRAC